MEIRDSAVPYRVPLFTLFRLLTRLVLMIFEHRRIMAEFTTPGARKGGAAQRVDPMQAVMEPYKRGDYETALAATEGLKEKGQPTSHYCFMRAAMLVEKGEYEEAERLFRQRITMEQEGQLLALSYSALGQLLMRLERYEEAMETFEKGLQYWPGKGGLHRDMAETLLRQGDNPEKALELARLAVKEESDAGSSIEGAHDINMAENLATLAWAVANSSGDRREIDRLANQAVPMAGKKVASSTALVHYQIGLAYITIGDSHRSQQHLSSAAMADSKGKWGRDAKKLMSAMRA